MNASQVILENRQRTIGASALRNPIVRGLACFAESGVPASQLRRGTATGKGIFLRRGQQTIEYALFISAVSLALVLMFTYAKRGVQAAIKGSADQMSHQYESDALANPAETSETTSEIVTESNDTTDITQVGDQRVYETESLTNYYGNTFSTSTTY